MQDCANKKMGGEHKTLQPRFMFLKCHFALAVPSSMWVIKSNLCLICFKMKFLKENRPMWLGLIKCKSIEKDSPPTTLGNQSNNLHLFFGTLCKPDFTLNFNLHPISKHLVQICIPAPFLQNWNRRFFISTQYCCHVFWQCVFVKLNREGERSNYRCS